VHQIIIDSKKAYDSVRRAVLCNILKEFLVFIKLVRLTKMCLNEMYSRVRLDKHLSAMLPIKNGLKQGALLSPLFFISAFEYTIRRVPVNQDGLN
jgi:hypothetical protein